MSTFQCYKEYSSSSAYHVSQRFVQRSSDIWAWNERNRYFFTSQSSVYLYSLSCQITNKLTQRTDAECRRWLLHWALLSCFLLCASPHPDGCWEPHVSIALLASFNPPSWLCHYLTDREKRWRRVPPWSENSASFWMGSCQSPHLCSLSVLTQHMKQAHSSRLPPVCAGPEDNLRLTLCQPSLWAQGSVSGKHIDKPWAHRTSVCTCHFHIELVTISVGHFCLIIAW